jgi:uncharacterized protein (TIGR02265 family)
VARALSDFIEPPWEAALDAESVIESIPREALIAGMFFVAVQKGAERRGITLPEARERYLPFGFYSIAKFAPLLVSAARVFYPDRPLREGLRAIGTAAPAAFSSSVLGKVTLGSAEGVHAVVTSIVNTYSINVRPSQCFVVESGPTSMIVSLNDVHHFLDSHHVGVFEGTLKYAGVEGRVLIAAKSSISAELLLEWRAPAQAR